VLGPLVVNYIREYQLAHGVPKAQVYDITMYVLAGFLALGFICNLLVRPLSDDKFMTDAELAAERKLSHDKAVVETKGAGVANAGSSNLALTVLAWAFVGIPLFFGIWITLQKAIILFK